MYIFIGINKAFDEQNISIKINGERVNNLRFADDTVILAVTHEDLKTLINRIVTVSDAVGYILWDKGNCHQETGSD